MNYEEPVSQQNPGNVHSNARCNHGMQNPVRLRAHVTANAMQNAEGRSITVHRRES